MATGFRVEQGRTYGMTMYPGYSSQPYHSPITVHDIRVVSSLRREVDLGFRNHAYAQGVQDMLYDLRIVKQEASYLAAELRHGDRMIVIVPLTRSWLEVHRLHPTEREMRELLAAA